MTFIRSTPMLVSLAVRLRAFRIKARHALHSARGKNILLYLMCLCVAFIFWILLSLDTEVQRDFDIPVELTNVPDSITLIDEMPRTINVSVQGKGSQLIRFQWGKLSPLKFRFGFSGKGKKEFAIGKTQIDTRIRDYFGSGTQVLSVIPDSIRISYTSDPGKTLPVHLLLNAYPNLQYIISGPITTSADSVKLYSAAELPESLSFVETEAVEKSELKDTTRFEVRIKPIKGVRIIPDRLMVTIPVEPLIAKRRQVRVDVINLPAGQTMLTFPGQVEVTYLVPMSEYADNINIKVYADYNELKRTGASKISVVPGATPEYFYNISITPDSVEYVIEQLD
ncbi:MAG: YbbR-like domain-containing protein [Muribaculaceae bacterium]|nr:YbbR-like domain-containing protein [Muribaculaceae bacterium]